MLEDELECRISVKLLLTVAFRLYLAEKGHLAGALVYEIQRQHPEHKQAREYYQMFTGDAAPSDFSRRAPRLFINHETGEALVVEAHTGETLSFEDAEKAKAYMDKKSENL